MRSLTLCAAIAAIVLALVHVRVAEAATISPGCAAINASSDVVLQNGEHRITQGDFFANEVVTLKSTLVLGTPVSEHVVQREPSGQALLATSSNTFPHISTFVIPDATASYTFRIYERSQNGAFTASFTCAAASGPSGGSLADSRLNYDPAAPAAVYCQADSIQVYAINEQGIGQLAFVVTDEMIDAVGIPSNNTLIASGLNIGLYRLTTGEFQINGPESPGDFGSSAVQQQSGSDIVYTVQPGDNLFRLALSFGTTVDAIAAANGISDPTRIFAGQEIVIPGGTGTPSTAGQLPHGQGYTFIWDGC